MRTKVLLAAVVAVILSTTAVTLASASGDSSSGNNDATVITLFSTQDKFTFLDLDQSGTTAPTMGDQAVFTECCSTIVAAARSGQMRWFARL